ncbi:MAG: hypothetical protein AAFR62_09635 [Cyanobacteria bacterium J06629_2]
MTENEFDSELDLLIPGDMPIAHSLNPQTAEKLSRALGIFLQALRETSASDALREIDRAIKCLGEIEITPADIANTKTFLKSKEVRDYDRYFKINRIQTPEPEIALVKGLLTNTQTFISLCQQCGDRLDSEQVAIQQQGFVTYAKLLARNFNLDIPDT